MPTIGTHSLFAHCKCFWNRQRLLYRNTALLLFSIHHPPSWYRNTALLLFSIHHPPSWFVRINCLQTGLHGFVKPDSDSSNWLRETGKSGTCLGLVGKSIMPSVIIGWWMKCWWCWLYFLLGMSWKSVCTAWYMWCNVVWLTTQPAVTNWADRSFVVL